MRKILVLLLVVASVPAFAASVSRSSLSLSEIRELRKETKYISKDFKRLLEETKEEAWDVSIGPAYSKAEDGSRSWSSPFELDKKFHNGENTFKILGDGYASGFDSNGAAMNGFSDVTLAISQSLKEDINEKYSLSATGGVTIPSGGNVGSSSANQFLSVAYTKEIQPSMEITFNGELKHLNEVALNTGGVAQAGSFKMLHKLANPDQDVFMQVLGVHRYGTPEYSELSVAYEGFQTPLEIQGAKAQGAIQLTRGLTVGSRNTALEFDLSFKLKP